MLYWKELSNGITVGYTDKGQIKYIIATPHNTYFSLENIIDKEARILAYIDKHSAIKAAEAIENNT